MRITRPSSRILVALVVATAFATAHGGTYKDAQKAYEMGEYVDASLLAMQHLRSKPKDKKAAEFLATVLPIAYTTKQTAAEDCRARKDWDGLVDAYRTLSKLTMEARTLPPLEGKKKAPINLPTVDVTSDLREATEQAAEFHYQKGVSMLEAGGGSPAATEFAAALDYLPNYKDSTTLGAESHYIKGGELHAAGQHKEAAVEFRSTKTFLPNYKDSEDLYNGCRQEATKRVAVMPFENMSGKAQFGAVGEMLSSQVLSKALNLDPEFIEFVNRDQLSALMAEKGQQDIGIIDAGSAPGAGRLAGVQAFVFGKILMINEDFPQDQVTSPLSNSVEWKNYNTGQVETVSATYQIHSRQGSVEITTSLSIVDGQTGAMLAAEQLQARRQDAARWVVFRGDERAIPGEVQSAQTPGGERPLQSVQSMVLNSIDELSSRLANKLISTFE